MDALPRMLVDGTPITFSSRRSFVDSFEAQLNAKRERLLAQLHTDCVQLKADFMPPLAFEPGQPIEEAPIEEIPTEEEILVMAAEYERFTSGQVIAE